MTHEQQGEFIFNTLTKIDKKIKLKMETSSEVIQSTLTYFKTNLKANTGMILHNFFLQFWTIMHACAR